MSREVFDEFAVPIWAIAIDALGDRAKADRVVEASFATFARSPGALAAVADPGTVLFSTARRIIFEHLLADGSCGTQDAPPAAASWARWRSALRPSPVVDPNRRQPPHPHSAMRIASVTGEVLRVASASTSSDVSDDVLLSWDPPVVRQPAGSSVGLRARVVALGSSVRGGPGPGLVLAAIGAMAAQLLHQFIGGASTLVLAVLVGMVIGNLGIASEATMPGLKLAAKRLLRAGVVLLGLRLSVGEVISLGVPALLLVATTVVITFFGVQRLGAKLGLSRDLSLLVATGYSICGASAIAAVEGATDADEEEVAVAIGLVTLAGSLAIFVVPAVAGAVGLGEQAAGAWAGASIHDVAQVVAAGSALGTTALATAVVVKLTRVVLLAPIVAGLNAKRSAPGPAAGTKTSGSRQPIMPLFVVGFLAMMALRTTGVVPLPAVEFTRSIEGFLFAVALVGLGSNVRVAKLRTVGLRPLLLGLLAWLLIGATSLAGVALVY